MSAAALTELRLSSLCLLRPANSRLWQSPPRTKLIPLIPLSAVRELKSPLAGSVHGYRAFRSISLSATEEIPYPPSWITFVTEPLLVINARLKESSA